MKRARQHDRRLWLLVLPVAAWGLHFLAAYVSAAIYCAKASAGAGLDAAKLAILAATIAALATLGVLAWRAGARYRRGAAGSESEDRFIGTTALMLCALSALAVIAVGSVAFFFADCRR